MKGAWAKLVRIAWKVEPGVAVNMVERFKNSTVTSEVFRLVRDDPAAVIDHPEALTFLLRDKLDAPLSSEVKKVCFHDFGYYMQFLGDNIFLFSTY